MNLVWLKKDLRLSDHPPLYFAIAAQTPFVVLFCFEPLLQTSDTFDVRHWWFMWQSLCEMQRDLAIHGIPLHIIYDDVLPALDSIHRHTAIETIFSHQETGIAITYKRDKAVRQFCTERNITWHEFQNGSIERGLHNRHEWHKRRNQTLRQATYEPNFKAAIPAYLAPDAIVSLLPDNLPQGVVQPITPFIPDPKYPIPGEKAAWQQLRSFFAQHNQQHTTNRLQPEATPELCSRLSAHLAYGNISIRQIWQFLQQQPRNRHLAAFGTRLLKQLNFIQMFEMECRIEHENLNFAFNGIRIKHNNTYLEAWKNGMTGFPLIDAAMRCVRQTGYLHSNMRAMVVSFLTHHLWLDWRKGGAAYLARMFLDFEPGIHYLQIQMAATCIGIDAVKVHNPIKQSRVTDPNAVFIKRWLPELQNIPPNLCHAPWEMTDLEQQFYRFAVGDQYPYPIIDHLKTQRFANTELNRVKNSATAQQAAKHIADKHGINP